MKDALDIFMQVRHGSARYQNDHKQHDSHECISDLFDGLEMAFRERPGVREPFGRVIVACHP